MAREYTVVPATVEHARAMAPNVREEDRLEAHASFNLTPLIALETSVQMSMLAWAWIVDDRVACMLGCAAGSIFDGVGVPWLLSTPLVERYRVPFLREHRQFLNEMLGLFPRLENMVDARYSTSIRWLRWMGFTVADEAISFGPFMMPFRHFVMSRGV